MTARNILYVTEPTAPVAAVAGSGFTHLVLSQCHIEQNPALQVFRIINGPVSSIRTLFRASDFSQWTAALDAGTFPQSLRNASSQAFSDAGEPLSANVTVTVNTAGAAWTLTDNASGNSFPMQVDPNGTFISFHGAPLTTITNTSTVASYKASLDNGQLPAALQQAAGLQGPNANYTVTQEPAQITGLPQWLITDTTSGFTWFVGIGSQGSPDVMVVRNYQDFFSPNLGAFVASLGSVVAAGIPVFVSLGGWTDDTTWAIMGSDTQQSLVVVAELLDTLGGSGVDYDWEGGPPSNVGAMTAFTLGLHAGMPAAMCTICPYVDTISTLLQVWQDVGFSGIAWANCMNYSPDNNLPSGVNSTFVMPLANAFPTILGSGPAAAPYVTAGFTATGLDSQQFASLVAEVVDGGPGWPPYPNLGGAFTYAFDFNVPNVSGALQTWASAVDIALSGGGADQYRAA